MAVLASASAAFGRCEVGRVPVARDVVDDLEADGAGGAGDEVPGDRGGPVPVLGRHHLQLGGRVGGVGFLPHRDGSGEDTRALDLHGLTRFEPGPLLARACPTG